MNFRKIIVAALAVAGLSAGVFAEVRPNAIGLRSGGGSLFGAEVNYQRAMGQKNRLELGGRYSSWGNYRSLLLGRTGTRYASFGAVGFYQWHFSMAPGIANNGFNWYAGPGGGIGMTTWETYLYGEKLRNGGDLYVDIGGQVGVEYDFNVAKYPFNVSLDMRPLIGALNDFDFGYDISFAVRWTF